MMFRAFFDKMFYDEKSGDVKELLGEIGKILLFLFIVFHIFVICFFVFLCTMVSLGFPGEFSLEKGANAGKMLVWSLLILLNLPRGIRSVYKRLVKNGKIGIAIKMRLPVTT